MKRLGFFTLGLPVVLVVFALPRVAKTVVELKDAQGRAVGTVIVWQQGPGVALQLKLHGLPPGEHAIHFHTNPKCDAPDFKSAGAHVNPENKKHGLEKPEGHHAGDMMNFTVDAKGNAKTKLEDKDANLLEDSHSLFSNGGTTIIIHAKADDMKNDPFRNPGGPQTRRGITKKPRPHTPPRGDAAPALP